MAVFPNSLHLFHAELGGMDIGTDSPTQMDASMDVPHLPGGAGGGWPSCLSCLSSGPQIQVEDQGEVDEEGGHLYECIKIPYKEDYFQSHCRSRGQRMLFHW